MHLKCLDNSKQSFEIKPVRQLVNLSELQQAYGES